MQQLDCQLNFELKAMFCRDIISLSKFKQKWTLYIYPDCKIDWLKAIMKYIENNGLIHLVKKKWKCISFDQYIPDKKYYIMIGFLDINFSWFFTSLPRACNRLEECSQIWKKSWPCYFNLWSAVGVSRKLTDLRNKKSCGILWDWKNVWT